MAFDMVQKTTGFRWWVAIAFAGFALPGTAGAQPICDAHIEGPGRVIVDGSGVGYDPFDTRTYREEFTLSVAKADGPACTIFLALQSQTASGPRKLQGLGDGLVYQLVAVEGAQIEITNDSTPQLNTPLTAYLPEGAAMADFKVSVLIDPGQPIHAGLYTDTLVALLFEGDPTATVAIDQFTANLETTTLPAAGVGVSSTNRAAPLGASFSTVDFGEIESEEMKNAYVNAFSTAGYKLRLTSDNQGKLVHRTVDDVGVDYITMLDGATLDLTPVDGDTLIFDGPTPINGAPHDLAIQIAPFVSLRAGEYEDFLRITITPVM